MRNRIVGIAVGLLVAAGILLWQSQRLVTPSWHLLPENEGAIASVAIQYNRESADYLLPCYRELLGRMDSDTEFIVVCGVQADADDFDRALASWNVERPERVHTLVVGAPITGWCKDRFLVANSSPALLLCPPLTETGLKSRTNDSLVAPCLERAYPQRFRAVDAPLYFDAGDIRATRTRVIVSDELWRKNGRPPDFKRRLARTFGRKVIWLRDAPDHHIGMYAAPIDERTVIVGDPQMGRKLWTKGLDEELGPADFSTEAAAPFVLAAEQLEAAGFEVVRVPLVVLGPKVYITYTNGVFETRGGKRIAYVPWYDAPELNEAAREAYESLGYEVRPIPIGGLYRFRGTIGCLVNVLERE